MSNQSGDSLQVECVEGFDGGLPQGFLLELVEMPALRLARNLSLQVSIIETRNYFLCSLYVLNTQTNKKKNKFAFPSSV